MHYSEIETLSCHRAPARAGSSRESAKPFAEIAWRALPEKVRRALRAAGALSLEGNYPKSRRKPEMETEAVIFSGNGKTASIVARDRRLFELIEDHVVHRRVAAVFRALETAVFADAFSEDERAALLANLPDPPELPAIPDWLERIEFARRPYRYADFESVLARGADAAEALRRVVEWAVANPAAAVALPGDYALLINAFLLLGDFRDKASFPAIVRFVSTPESVCYFALGDLITEYLPEILARTYNGNLPLLAGLIENRDAYEFSRRSAVGALACPYWDGVLPREPVARYLADLLGRGDPPEGPNLCGAVANVVADLRFEELSKPVRRAFSQGLIDQREIDEATFLEEMRSAKPARRHIGAEEPLWIFQIRAYWLTEEYLTDQALGSRYRREAGKAGKIRAGREIGGGAMPPPAPRKIGRNEPCPCGSGKKYKKCCGAAG